MQVKNHRAVPNVKIGAAIRRVTVRREENMVWLTSENCHGFIFDTALIAEGAHRRLNGNGWVPEAISGKCTLIVRIFACALCSVFGRETKIKRVKSLIGCFRLALGQRCGLHRHGFALL